MKKYFLLFFLLTAVSSFAQQEVDLRTKNIATFTRVWGFLKYYHPEVKTGKLDWDKEFTARVPVVEKLATKEEYSTYFMAWIASLGEIRKRKARTSSRQLTNNLDLQWISDTSLFSVPLTHQLELIRDNRNQDSNFYVTTAPNVGNTKYTNEKAYPDSVYPSAPLRLLGLARYWNAINYFFPYKYLIGTDWNDILTEMIPKFRDAEDTLEYHLAMLELTARINDSHSGLVTPYTNRYFGYKWAPFSFQLIDGKAVVTGFYNDSLATLDDIRKGDVILEAGGRGLMEIFNEKSKYIAASNYPTQLRNSYYAIFNGSTDSLLIKYERNGEVKEKTIHRYLTTRMRPKWLNSESTDTFKILDGNIGYVNMGILEYEQVHSMMQSFSNTKAIIFDVRNYPRGTMFLIAVYLQSTDVPFAKFSRPDLSYPGTYRYTPIVSCGGKNKKPYKGKVVLLFNEWSQSHSEYTLMALKSVPGAITIGSQTAGADGNVSFITFPGNYTTRFSGIGVYYPDGEETQRIGIVPDIEVKPTIQGIREGRDEVLEKALELLK